MKNKKITPVTVKTFLTEHLTFWICVSVFSIVLAMMTALLLKYGYAPFGSNSLACVDADIQYLDFFAYFKDVLSGQNSLMYSFSKSLGSTGIGLYSYYLASPFNLLVIFFPKEAFHIFFDALVALKLATCGATMAFYLQKRFYHRLKSYLVILLSLGYAFMHYNIAQGSNIMWLDGVYMLPLMLLGVYKLVRNRKDGLMLAVTVGLSVVFNWYTGAINCLFSVFWLFFEIGIKKLNFFGEEDAYPIKTILRDVIRYSIAMLFGMGLSAVLFLPTVANLRNGKGGAFDWKLLTKNIFNGNPFATIQSFVYGTLGTPNNAVLFCGSVALLGCMLFFVSGYFNRKQKIFAGCFLIINLMFYYWNPFFMTFSLLKYPNNYWFRYLYVSVFSIIFIAALFFAQSPTEAHFETKILKAGISFAALLIFLQYIHPAVDLKLSIYTGAVFAMISAGIAKIYILEEKHRQRSRRMVMIVLLCVLACGELAYNTKILMKTYHVDTVRDYHQYVQSSSRQIRALKTYDRGSFYRIGETSTRRMRESGAGTTANYNEAFVNAYASNAGYSSTNDGNVVDFYDRAGYKEWAKAMNAVNDPVVPIDALTGTKYVLSSYPIKGFKRVEGVGRYNHKTVYQNPYVFPFAFSYRPVQKIKRQAAANPFGYQNKIISSASGIEAEYYMPAVYHAETRKTKKGLKKIYQIEVPKDGLLYVYFPWKKENNGVQIDLNGCKKIAYACWLSPSVVYVPTKAGETTAKITVTMSRNFIFKDEQLFVLDLSRFRKASAVINRRAAQKIQVKNKSIFCEIDGKTGEALFLSVPEDKAGWRITRNGKKITADTFADCFISIPLQSGKNKIEMHYRVPMFKIGGVISLLTLSALVCYEVLKRKDRLSAG